MTIKKSKDCQKITRCRICQSKNLVQYLDLDYMPIPNGFVTKKRLSVKEIYYPLQISFCPNCTLSQLNHVVSPVKMFKNYLYIPSTSKNLKKHFEKFAKDVKDVFIKSTDEMIIDIGSNDGTLLSFFKKLDFQVLGIDPAANLAKTANKNNIPTINDYFTLKLAKKIQSKKKAKIITATNVMAHIDNLHDAVAGVKTLLVRDGVFVMETPYVLDLLSKNEFDTIYHEHLSYFSVKSLEILFKKHDLRIIDIKKQKIHGGTIRIFVTHVKNSLKANSRVKNIIDLEQKYTLHKPDIYLKFERNVKKNRETFIKILQKLKKSNKKIVGYGAAAKGNVFLNYYKLGMDDIPYIVDSISYKQGKYTPGIHIPIFPERKLTKDKVDYVIIFAWNFAKEIIEKNKDYRERGGQFIITIPYLKIV